MKDLTKQIDHILTAVSGKRAWNWVAKLSQYHRIQGSSTYHDAAELVMEEFRRLNLDEVQLHQYPADGVSANWEWYPPYSWDIRSGFLSLVEPEEDILVTFDEVPMSVVTHSNPCDITAEIVDVGAGDSEQDYEGKDVNGKIILMSGSPRGGFLDLIGDKGVVGIIIYPDAARAGAYPDMIRYDGFWPTHDNKEKLISGHSISYAQALILKALLSKGTVVVHSKIDARLYDGQLDVVSAAITGSECPEQEIVISAHLCHPAAGANDNASGVAGVLELARALHALIEAGRVAPLKRTVRFLLIPEFFGTVAYMKALGEKSKHIVANVNLDMIGEHPQRIGFPFVVSQAPHSTPFFLNDLIRAYVEHIADHPKGIAVNGTSAPMKYRLKGYGLGSDHNVFNDVYFGIPSVMFGHNDHFHHTNLDIPEMCDPTEMQRVIAIALGTAISIGNATRDHVHDLWYVQHQGLSRRLGIAARLLKDIAYDLGNSADAAHNPAIPDQEKALLGFSIIKNAVDFEKRAFDKLLQFCGASPQAAEIQALLVQELEAWKNVREKAWFQELKRKAISYDATQADRSFGTSYRLAYDGPINSKLLHSLTDEPEILALNTLAGSNGIHAEAIFLAGLHFDIKSIASLLSLQFGGVCYPGQVQAMFDMLEKRQIMNASN